MNNFYFGVILGAALGIMAVTNNKKAQQIVEKGTEKLKKMV